MQLDLIASEIREERAGICEFDGLLTRQEAEARGLLESEQYREACEIRAICAMPTREERAEYIDAAEKKRGKEAADKLRFAVTKEWQRRRDAISGQA